MLSFAFNSYALGEEKQMRGFGLALAERQKQGLRLFNKQDFFVPTITGEALKLSKYPSFKEFQQKVDESLDCFFATGKIKEIPKVFVTAYPSGDNDNAARNADALCKAVKNYYLFHELGEVKTVILTAAEAEYQYADYINLPEHLLKQNSNDIKGSQKYIITKGIINDMSKVVIGQAYNNNKALQTELAAMRDEEKPNVVFCLGGRVEGPEIPFDLTVAEDIVAKAGALRKQGYNVTVTNGPRTPSGVTDYLFEAAQSGDFAFYNSKSIAKDEKEAANWRNYSGKYTDAFIKQFKRVGNVYPAILKPKNTVVVHTFDSFASCETAQAGIPTVIYTGKLKIDPKVRPDCYKLAATMVAEGYAVGLNEFISRGLQKSNFKQMPPVTGEIAKIIYDDLQAKISRNANLEQALVAREVIAKGLNR